MDPMETNCKLDSSPLELSDDELPPPVLKVTRWLTKYGSSDRSEEDEIKPIKKAYLSEYVIRKLGIEIGSIKQDFIDALQLQCYLHAGLVKYGDKSDAKTVAAIKGYGGWIKV